MLNIFILKDFCLLVPTQLNTHYILSLKKNTFGTVSNFRTKRCHYTCNLAFFYINLSRKSVKLFLIEELFSISDENS